MSWKLHHAEGTAKEWLCRVCSHGCLPKLTQTCGTCLVCPRPNRAAVCPRPNHCAREGKREGEGGRRASPAPTELDYSCRVRPMCPETNRSPCKCTYRLYVAPVVERSNRRFFKINRSMKIMASRVRRPPLCLLFGLVACGVSESFTLKKISCLQNSSITCVRA
jgi:hypothetical protein